MAVLFVLPEGRGRGWIGMQFVVYGFLSPAMLEIPVEGIVLRIKKYQERADRGYCLGVFVIRDTFALHNFNSTRR